MHSACLKRANNGSVRARAARPFYPQKPNYAGQRAVRLGEKSDLPKFVLLASAPSKLPEMQQAGSDGSQITAAHLAG